MTHLRLAGLLIALAVSGSWPGVSRASGPVGVEPGQNTDLSGLQIAQQGFRGCEPNCGFFSGGQRPEEPGGAAHFFRTLDRNGDSKVSRNEFKGPARAFDLMDADGDGLVTRDEFNTFKQRREGNELPSPAIAADGPKLPAVVTHAHLAADTDRGNGDMDWKGAANNALATMDKFGIRTAVILPPPLPPDRSDDSLIDGFFEIARQHPDRFAVAGGGASLNGMIQRTRPDRVSERLRQRFTERAEELVRRGAVGFGEMTALHFSLFQGHPFEESPPDHPLFLLLADLAARHDIPIDLHMEAVAQEWPVSDQLHRRGNSNPERVSANIAAFERLLAHNRRARIIWVHVGMDSTGHRTVDLTRRLLRENANLFISITSNQLAEGEDWFFKPGTGLNPRWRALILEFPDRFMIGTDTFFQPDSPLRKMPDRTPFALGVTGGSALPPEVRRKVAFANAERLFKLKGAQVPDDAVAARAAPPRPPAPPRFLGEAEIRRTVIGNTLNFDAPSNGKNTFVYFAADGTAETRVAGQGAGPIRKRWFFNPKGLLCRTVGKQNRNHCTRVQSTSDSQTLTMRNQKVQYPATVLSGRKFTR